MDRTLNATAVVLDDQNTSRTVLAAVLTHLDWALTVHSFADPVECLAQIGAAPPDLILVDHRMPGLTGIEFTARFRALPGCTDVPLVIVTGVMDRSVRLRALEAGATDFLLKPVDFHECRARCHNMLTLRHQQKLIRRRAEALEAMVSEVARTVHTREQETLLRLARAGEYRDHATGHHVERVARYVRLIGEGLNLPTIECETMALAAQMHDIGKMGIPDSILLSATRHTDEQSTIMHRHTVIGHEILRDSPSLFLQVGAEIALHHHERHDGSGYPSGLCGNKIPLSARITAVADVFDALSSHRTYRRAWSLPETIDYNRRQAGIQFDPECAGALLRSQPRAEEVYYHCRDFPESKSLPDDPRSGGIDRNARNPGILF